MTNAEAILKEIKQANSILLHCHPSPDPDSVGSALAMKFALEQLGKKATVIQGDSEIPHAFMHFPGAEMIEKKKYAEMDLAQFDLFIVLDCSRTGITREIEFVFPPHLKVINIDHHRTNEGSGSINLIDPSYPANCLLLFDLFMEWGVRLTPEIASNLFIGSYTDTGGFKYAGVAAKTFDAVARMAEHIPNLPELVAKMENSNTPGVLAFEGVGLSAIKEYFGILAVSTIPHSVIKEKGISTGEVKPGLISSILRSVPRWKISAAGAEAEPGMVKWSFRSTDAELYDVSKLAAALGGGGHKAAAGAILNMSLEEATHKVVETTKVLYNL